MTNTNQVVTQPGKTDLKIHCDWPEKSDLALSFFNNVILQIYVIRKQAGENAIHIRRALLN